MHSKLHITRYNKTRNWAIWANEELLAVTVYRKGAQAVLDYIHTLTQNTINTMSKTKTTAAATTATNNNADFDPTIIKAVNGEGKTIRIKFDPLGVSVCYNLKGTAKSRDCASTLHEKPTTKDSAAHKAAFALLASSIADADTLDCCVFSIIEEYHPSAYMLLPSRKKVQKMHNFKRFCACISIANAVYMQT